MTNIYNPFSILNALDMNKIRDYWFATDDLPKRIPHNQRI